MSKRTTAFYYNPFFGVQNIFMAAYCSFESLFFFPPSLVRKQCVNCSSSSLFFGGAYCLQLGAAARGTTWREREIERERELPFTVLHMHMPTRTYQCKGGKEALYSYSIFFSCSQEIPRLIAAMQQGRRPSVRRRQKAATQKQPYGRYNLVTFFRVRRRRFFSRSKSASDDDDERAEAHIVTIYFPFPRIFRQLDAPKKNMMKNTIVIKPWHSW